MKITALLASVVALCSAQQQPSSSSLRGGGATASARNLQELICVEECLDPNFQGIAQCSPGCMSPAFTPAMTPSLPFESVPTAAPLLLVPPVTDPVPEVPDPATLDVLPVVPPPTPAPTPETPSPTPAPTPETPSPTSAPFLEVPPPAALTFSIINPISNRALAVDNCDDGTSLKLSTIDQGSTTQQFYFGPDNSIINVGCNNKAITRSIDCVAASPITLSEYTGVTHQEWIVEDQRIVSTAPDCNFVLDIFGRQTVNGAAIILYFQNGQDNQVWEIAPTLSLTAAPVRAPTLSPLTSTFSFINPNSNRALGVDSCEDGSPMKLLTFDPSNTMQQFYFASNDSIISVGCNQKAITRSLICAPASPITLSDQIRGGRQEWVVEGSRIVSRRSDCNLVVDIFGRQTSDGANIILYYQNGQENQVWEVRRT